MSNEYCCQIHSASGRVLEIFHNDFLEAVRECTYAEKQGATLAMVFHYPDMDNPICVARSIKNK